MGGLGGRAGGGWSHCFWNFSQAPQTLHPGPAPGSLSLTHPSFVSAVVNGKVHSALQPKRGCLHRCLLSDHPVHPLPPSVCLQGFPPVSHLHSHLTAAYLTGLETCSPLKGPSPSPPLFSPLCPSLHQAILSSCSLGLSLHCKSDLITPILKNPSRPPTAPRI